MSHTCNKQYKNKRFLLDSPLENNTLIQILSVHDNTVYLLFDLHRSYPAELTNYITGPTKAQHFTVMKRHLDMTHKLGVFLSISVRSITNLSARI